ncbi:hypothetical protein RB595_002217 [Gaeumannomyces hyphopodioides]
MLPQPNIFTNSHGVVRHRHPLAAIRVCAPAELDGYEIYNTTWVAEVRPQGEVVELNGTLQQVHAQLLRLNPNYNADFHINMEGLRHIHEGWSMFCINAGCPPTTTTTTTTSSKLLQDDTVYTFRGFVQTKCLHHDSLARMKAIDEGVWYLRNVRNARPKNGPGPNNCGRVSCSWAAGIYWCNDHDEELEVYEFNTIADGAHWAAHMCQFHPPGVEVIKWGGGQALHVDNWRVVVIHDPSDGCDIPKE